MKEVSEREREREKKLVFSWLLWYMCTVLDKRRGERTRSWTELVLSWVLTEPDRRETELHVCDIPGGALLIVLAEMVCWHGCSSSTEGSWDTVSFSSLLFNHSFYSEETHGRYLLFLKQSSLDRVILLLLFEPKSSCVVFHTIVPPCGHKRHCELIDALLLTIFFLLFFSLFLDILHCFHLETLKPFLDGQLHRLENW